MKETVGDLWELARFADAVVVTTNGEIHWDGQASMGAGCALEAAQRYPWLPQKLGELLRANGNQPYLFQISPEQGMYMALVTFPTKHHWREKSDLKLIVSSARTLARLATEQEWARVILPRPGCGLGRLSWEDVKPLLTDILDDRFVVTTFSEESMR